MTKFARCVNSDYWQLTNRNITPTARKRLVPQKQSREPVAQSLPLITTLPAEILDEILGIVLKDGMLESIKQKTPILGLQQYRALIITCKTFKAIVDNACLNLTIRCGDIHYFKTTTRIVVEPWDDFTTTDTQNHRGESRCHIASLKRWNELFKSFQLISVRHMSSFGIGVLGRFWYNPSLHLDDFPFFVADFLQHLRPLFERTKRPPTNVEREQISLNTQLLYSRDDIVNVITERDKTIMMHSVRTWKSRDILLSSRYVSARVKEWWIVDAKHYYRSYSFIVGYYGTRSLVIGANDWRFYETVASKKPVWRY